MIQNFDHVVCRWPPCMPNNVHCLLILLRVYFNNWRFNWNFEKCGTIFQYQICGSRPEYNPFPVAKRFFLKKIEKVPLTYSSELIESFLTFDSYYYCLFSVRSNVRPRGFKAHDLWLFPLLFFFRSNFRCHCEKG